MLMVLVILLWSFLIASVIYILFSLASNKKKWEKWMTSIFECGYTSNHASRFSFSIHFFLVGLIFLFLDLELCILMPLLNESSSSNLTKSYFVIFVIILLVALITEWKESALDWES